MAAITRSYIGDFISLAICRRERFPLVEKAIKQCLEPFYGDQSKLLRDIEKRNLRKTEILIVKDKAIGFISYLREPQKLKDVSCLEVTALGLFDPEKDGGKGYGTMLIQRIEKIATEERLGGIYCNLPSFSSLIEFFKKKEFSVENTRADYPKKGVDELMLFRSFSRKRKVTEEIDSERELKRPNLKEESFSDADAGMDSSRTARSSFPNTSIHLGGNQHQLTLKKIYIDPIRKGIKTVEGRINSGAPARFKVGDSLRFFYTQNSFDDVTVRIRRIEKYSDFFSMLDAVGFQKCIPSASSLKEADQIYQNIPGFPERARQNGVVAIHLEKI